jgi:cathepsin F
MKLLLVIVVVAATVAIAKPTDEQQWALFKKTYGRTYPQANGEETHRFGVFQANLRTAERLQAADPAAQWGVTQFMDLTPSEFRAQYANLNVTRFVEQRDAEKVPLLTEADFGADVKFGTNWKGRAVTGVKNQGSCGSCWTFSATGAMEGCWAIKGHGLVPLSESNILDCMPGNAGCKGGDPRAAIAWAARNGGLMTEAAYPYVGAQRACHQSTPRYGPTSGAVSVGRTETAVRGALGTAPLSVCIDATPLQYYTGGIISAQCGYRNTNHAVLLVADEGNAYTFKNSWGAWGESGYFRASIGVNCLNLVDYVTRAC